MTNDYSEEGKREVEKEAFQLLINDPNVNFFGNLEGKDILQLNVILLLRILVKLNIELRRCCARKIFKEEISQSIFRKIGYLF